MDLLPFTDEDSCTQTSLQQEMHGLYQQAKVSLREIIRIPGVWDPFVICYVDVRAPFV